MSFEPQSRVRTIPALCGLFVLFFLAQATGQTNRHTTPHPPARPQSTAAQKFTFHEDFTSNTYKSYAQDTDWNVWNHTFEVSLADGFVRYSPVMTIDSTGNIYLAWFDYRLTKISIYLQKIDPNGNRLWPSDLRIEALPCFTRMSLLSDEQGNVFLFWPQWQNINDKTKVDIYAQKIDPQGTLGFPSGGKVFLPNISQTATEVQPMQFPEITYANNYFYFIWYATRTDLYLQKIDRNANQIWIPNLLIFRSTYSFSKTWEFAPAITVNSLENILAVWRECQIENWANTEMPTHTFAQLFNKDGNSIWIQPTLVAAVPSKGKIEAAFDPAGNAVIVWADYLEMDPNHPQYQSYGIYAQRISLQGSILWNPRGLMVSSRRGAGEPHITFNPDGFFAVAWQDQYFQYGDIFLHTINGDGTFRWATEVIVNLDRNLHVRNYSNLGLDPRDNSVRLAWLDNNVFTQKVSVSGLHLWQVDCKVNDVLGAVNQKKSVIASDRNGSAYTLWVDDRNVNPQLFIQRMDPVGGRVWEADIVVGEFSRLVSSSQPTYISRAPISLDRLSYDGPNGTVEYRPKSSPGHPLLADDAPHQDPLEVLASVTDHIPDIGQQLLRYLGWYSNKSRGLRKKAARTAAAATPTGSSPPAAKPLAELDDTPFRKACRRTWAQLIAKIYLVSPLICPKCRGPMKIVSFIEDQAVVRKILQHLGLWETQPRPPPKKIVPLAPVEPVREDPFSWAADPIYSYDDPDPVYPD